MQEHEYALLNGINRSTVGRYLSVIAASLSAAIVFFVLSLDDLAKKYGLPVNVPPVVLTFASASSVFLAIYALFNRYGWKFPGLGRFLQVPDLKGTWRCSGQTLNPDKTPSYSWEGTITIVQTWDKIRVHLSTKNSCSDSVAAAVLRDEVDGYRLLYHYRNNPSIGSADLSAHYGFSELVFDKTVTSATGEYFNGHGRYTFGTLKLVRQ